MSGLVVSPIDKWFMGPVPQFTAHDLGVPEERQDLRAVIARARSALKDPQQTAWQSVSLTSVHVSVNAVP